MFDPSGRFRRDLAGARRAAADEHRAARRDRRAAALLPLGDGADEVAQRLGGRERGEHELDGLGRRGRRRAPGGRVERDAARRRLLVQDEGSTLAGALPRPGEADAVDAERPVGRDAGARAVGVRGRREHAVHHQHPARVAHVPVEEVTVDPGDGRARRDAPLHLRDLLAPDDRVVREDRLERVEADGARRAQDVHDDRSVRREVDVALVRDPRHEQSRLRLRRRCEDERRQSGCNHSLSEHDPRRR